MATQSMLRNREPLIVEMGPEELVRLFDREARDLLQIEGREAYCRIVAGDAGDNYAWADLRLLFYLLPAAPQWPS